MFLVHLEKTRTQHGCQGERDEQGNHHAHGHHHSECLEEFADDAAQKDDWRKYGNQRQGRRQHSEHHFTAAVERSADGIGLR